MSSARNLLTVWADLLLDTLAVAGITEVVASPGSRSTPFLLAAVRHASLRVHMVIDERSAAFFALGMARATGRPPLLLCTSGTAPAHYYPAIIEASEAALPLVVLSADRPAELVRANAPQTTDQARLYGAHARCFCDLGEPSPHEASLLELSRSVRRAVELALGPEPGPVQLNAPARKPLEPRAAETEEERTLAARAAGIERSPVTPIRSAGQPGHRRALAQLTDALASAERPVLFAGPLPVDTPREAILEFAARAGLTVLAEATSQLRFGPRIGVHFADAFESWIAETAPDVVVEIGATPTSGAYLRWLDTQPAVRRFVLGGARSRDPSATAEAVVLGDLAPILAALEVPAVTRSDDAYREAEERAWATIDAALLNESELSEATAARRVVAAMPDGSWLGLGNSLPIRHVDRFVRGGGPRLRVLSQRGVSGIDGWIAASAGAAMATREPSAVLLGDVSFAHDVGSLALAARVTTPLVIVVLDNGGGRIFEQLPIASGDLPIDMELFTTPSSLEIGSAARAYGIAYAKVRDREALDTALEAALGRSGATVLRVRVPPHGAADLQRRLKSTA